MNNENRVYVSYNVSMLVWLNMLFLESMFKIDYDNDFYNSFIIW